MAKIDKSQYTKKEWQKIRDQRRADKAARRNAEHIANLQEQKEEKVNHNISKEIIDRPLKKDVAFVLGNGTSRSDIRLNPLRNYGLIYGCNAIYRDFDPDYLVAVDTKMVLEINKYHYQHKVETWTNPNKAYAKMTGFNFFNPSKGWSSGPTALWLASETGYKIIYILGFDYKGTGENNLYLNNIYAGTFNYKNKTDKAIYFGNWLKQTVVTMQKHSNIRYIRVIEDNGFIPKELVHIPNLEHITVAEFKKIYND